MHPIRLPLFVLLAVASARVFAHGDLPTPAWCEGGDPREVASFSFGGDALSFTRDAEPDGESKSTGVIICADGKSPDQSKNCGQFDDDYKRGGDAGHRYCNGFKRPRRPGEVADAGTVVTLVTEPASFLGPTHHSDYTLNQGLAGVCVRCESRSVPILPVTRSDKE